MLFSNLTSVVLPSKKKYVARPPAPSSDWNIISPSFNLCWKVIWPVSLIILVAPAEVWDILKSSLFPKLNWVLSAKLTEPVIFKEPDTDIISVAVSIIRLLEPDIAEAEDQTATWPVAPPASVTPPDPTAPISVLTSSPVLKSTFPEASNTKNLSVSVPALDVPCKFNVSAIICALELILPEAVICELEDILPLAPVVANPPATTVIPSVPPTVNTSPPA